MDQYTILYKDKTTGKTYWHIIQARSYADADAQGREFATTKHSEYLCARLRASVWVE